MSYVSPYRNIFAKPKRKEECYQDINVSTAPIDSNMLAANARFVAVPWEGTGGGSLCVLPILGEECYGKVGTKANLLSGHKAPVIDVAFNPFNDFVVASAAEDATIRLWNIEQDSPRSVKPSTDPSLTLTGHARKVCRLAWNPIVNGALASFGAENSIKLWDVQHGKAALSIKGPTQQFFDVAWSQDGNSVILPCKDRKVHVYDIRAGKEAYVFQGHHGMKGSRAIFDTALNYAVTTGFSQTAARQVSLWDIRNLDKRIGNEDVDFNSGVLIPFIDVDLHIVYTFARGDLVCSYYELTTNSTPLCTLSKYQSQDPFRAIAQAPKYSVDTTQCEVDRFWVVTGNDKVLHHFPMIVPRMNADFFQEDLYPETNAPEPAIQFDNWKEGGNGEPKKISLEGGVKLAEATGFTVSDSPAEDVESLKKQIEELKAENAQLKARIQELEGH